MQKEVYFGKLVPGTWRLVSPRLCRAGCRAGAGAAGWRVRRGGVFQSEAKVGKAEVLLGA